MPRFVFIFGYPIAHSISPAIHNAAFGARKIDGVYVAREVAPDGLPAAVEELRRDEALGANITVPHKEAVLGLVDAVDEPAALIGAANTLYKSDGRLHATNTDAEGFGRSLDDIGVVVGARPVVLLGAGGSARAVAFALLSRGAQHLVVMNRTEERAQRLAADLLTRFPGRRIEASGLGAVDRSVMAERELIVNTTTVGLHGDETPLSSELLAAALGGAVVDIIYNPARTRLLREAEAAGLRTLNGLPMLVYQAAAAWEIWTGETAPVESMFEAARVALAERERARTGR